MKTQLRSTITRWGVFGTIVLTLSLMLSLGSPRQATLAALQQPSPWDISWAPNDQQAVAAQIDTILAGSGLAGYGGTILNYALTSRDGLNPNIGPGVNPAFALAMFRKEAEFAKPGSIAERQNNPGNIICKNGTQPIYGASGCANGFGVYSSMDAGIRAFFWLLNAQYKPGGVISSNCQDIDCVIRKYCPPGHCAPPGSECDTECYIAQVTGWTQQYQSQLSGGNNDPGCTDDAQFVGQSPYPTVSPGQSFQIYFEVRNTGTCTWQQPDYYLGNMNGTTLGAEPRQELGGDVRPGEIKGWTINMTAPSTPGTYRTQWMVKHSDHEFGPNMYIDVTVEDVPGCNGDTIGFDQTVEGWLSNFIPWETYCFTASAGQWISVRMFSLDTTATLDPYVKLYDPDGRLIYQDDDGAVANAAFFSYRLPVSGTYRLVATRYGPTSGDYRLRLESGHEAAVGDVNRDCVVDDTDYQLLANVIGTSDQNADLNLDGFVNTNDLSILLINSELACSQYMLEQGAEETKLQGWLFSHFDGLGCWTATLSTSCPPDPDILGPLVGSDMIDLSQYNGQYVQVTGHGLWSCGMFPAGWFNVTRAETLSVFPCGGFNVNELGEICFDFVGPVGVGVEDTSLVAYYWHKQGTPPSLDLDWDMDIDSIDIMTAVSSWGMNCPNGSALCTPDWTLGCNASDSWNNGASGSTDLIDIYPCSPWDESGPEYAYTFTPSVDGQVEISLSNMSADLDLFILTPGCNATSCIAYGDATASFDAVAGQIYYVVVDGYQGAVSDYTIGVSCPAAVQTQGDRGPDKSPQRFNPGPTAVPGVVTPHPTASPLLKR